MLALFRERRMRSFSFEAPQTGEYRRADRPHHASRRFPLNRSLPSREAFLRSGQSSYSLVPFAVPGLPWRFPPNQNLQLICRDGWLFLFPIAPSTARQIRSSLVTIMSRTPSDPLRGPPPSKREAFGAYMRLTGSRSGPLPEGAVSEADWGSQRELAGRQARLSQP